MLHEENNLTINYLGGFLFPTQGKGEKFLLGVCGENELR